MSERTSRSLEAQAAAFAQILAATDDTDVAFRQAAALAGGLFPHQVEGVAFLLGRSRAILADDMGLGKTRQALAALSHAAPAGQVLIVCPASVKRNWAREISLASVEGSVHIMEGTARQRIPRDARWVVANYDILGRHVDAIGAVPWAGLIFDEAHYLKNHTSARSKVARELASRAAEVAKQEPPVYLLTGTPLTNRPRDLFVLLQLVGHPLGRSFLSFAKRYCDAKKTDYGWKTDGASHLEELTVQLQGTMLRRAKEEVLSLPPKLRAWLPTTDAAGIATREMREVVDLLVARATGDSEASDQRSRTRLLAILTKARQKVAVAKVPTTLELVRGAVEQGEKVIVFSCFEDPLQQLADAFGSAAVVLTGKVPSGQRQRLVDRFQKDDDVRVFLANIIAGGTGVTLTAATQVISTTSIGCPPITGRTRIAPTESDRPVRTTSPPSLVWIRSTSSCRRCSRPRRRSCGRLSRARRLRVMAAVRCSRSWSVQLRRCRQAWQTRASTCTTRTSSTDWCGLRPNSGVTYMP